MVMIVYAVTALHTVLTGSGGCEIVIKILFKSLSSGFDMGIVKKPPCMTITASPDQAPGTLIIGVADF